MAGVPEASRPRAPASMRRADVLDQPPTLREPLAGTGMSLPIGPGTVLDDRYRLDERVGDGGTATVYRGTDTLLHRPVAVKVFRPNPADPTVADRLAREIRLAAAVSCPDLVAVYDAHPGAVTRSPASASDLCYLVTEFVDGPNLSHTLADGGLDPDRVRRIGLAIARALAALHEGGLVHRDVKPGNILLSATDQAKLTDLGIARELAGQPVTRDNVVPGTAPYLSPEQARGRAVGPPSDIYSLGLVLLECLTGNREFPGAPLESAVARLLRDPVVPGRLPPPWPGLLRSMTDRRSARRPTAAQVVAALTGGPQIASDRGAVAAPPSPNGPVPASPPPDDPTENGTRPEGGRRHRRLAWIGAVVVAVSAVIAAVATTGADDPGPAQPSGATPTSVAEPSPPPATTRPDAPTPTATATVEQPAAAPIPTGASDAVSAEQAPATSVGPDDQGDGPAQGPVPTTNDTGKNDNGKNDNSKNDTGKNGNGHGAKDNAGNGNGNGNG